MEKNRPWERWDDPGVTEEIDRYWLADPGGYEAIHRSILSKLVRKFLVFPTEKVLEVGCGSGLVYRELIPEVLVNSSYVGVDNSTKMLEIARKRFPMGQFVYGDVYDLQFPSNSFDMTLCFEVLGHLPEIQKPIDELFRVAGRLVIFTVWISPEYQTLCQTEEIQNSRFLHKLYSHDEIISAVRQAVGGEPHWIETRILSETIWGYIIFKGQIAQDMRTTRGAETILPFPGLLEVLTGRHVEERTEIERLRGEAARVEELLNKLQKDLSERDTEVGQIRVVLGSREAELRQMEGDLSSLENELERVQETLESREAQLLGVSKAFQEKEDKLSHALTQIGDLGTELEQVRQVQAGREKELKDVNEKLESREVQFLGLSKALQEKEAKLSNALTHIGDLGTELKQVQQALTHRGEDLEQTQQALTNRVKDLQSVQSTLGVREVELNQIRNKGKSISWELDLFRHRKITRWVNRFFNKSDLRNDISPAFQQLKDDSFIFGENLNKFRLQPSVNLQRVPFVYYPLELKRANLQGILLAPIMDLLSMNGVLGVEIVSPTDSIVAQAFVPISQIDDSGPTSFDFSAIPNTDQGRFWLRVFVRDTDTPVRVFEWRKYPVFGLGRLQTKAFCGFIFENAR
ncbi:MAG: hypothetical protein A2V86_05690 [Deltaproteobacteria bacterium RBG_16_49_23]|nr:MAG: hypothetical protein A2V86_05690 [Deltaproteobacteria bacterium RBG_16_49_23]